MGQTGLPNTDGVSLLLVLYESESESLVHRRGILSYLSPLRNVFTVVNKVSWLSYCEKSFMCLYLSDLYP